MIKKIANNFIKHCYVYLPLIAIAIVSTVYYCNFINMPKGKETISLFLSTYTDDTSKFREVLNANKPDYLREINTINVKPDDPNFGYYFVNRGLNMADLFILPEDKLNEDLLNKQFAKLDDNYIRSYLPNYVSEDSNHGILLHKVGDKDKNILSFNKSGSKDMNYYIFYRINSIHIGKLNTISEDDLTLIFSKAVIEHE